MKQILVLVALTAVMLAGSTAQATPLTPGQKGAPSVINISGDKLVASGSHTENGKNDQNQTVFTATLTYAVYRTAAGTLDFVYQITNSAGSMDSLERLANSRFRNVTTDVGYSATDIAGGVFSNSGTVVPTQVTRSSGLGDIVGFNFDTAIAPGATTQILVIRTNARSFSTGSSSIINGGTANYGTFQPTPEPTSLVLLGSCLAGLGATAGWRRFRQRKPVVA